MLEAVLRKEGGELMVYEFAKSNNISNEAALRTAEHLGK